MKILYVKYVEKMSEEMKKKFQDLTFAGYYEEDKTYTMEILKEDLIKFLKEAFEVDNLKIVYKCLTCGMIKKNIKAKDDNFDKILEIMSNPQ